MSTNLDSRSQYIQYFFFAASFILLLTVANLQLCTNSANQKGSEIDPQPVYPARGLIFDRNGILLVNNTPVYDLEILFSQVNPKMDTFRFCELLGIDTAYFNANFEKNWKSKKYSKTVPYTFLSKIPPDAVARFQENLHEFPGFYIKLRSVRSYPHNSSALLLGDIREVNAAEVSDTTKGYRPGDYIGSSGLERRYEDLLSGKKGVQYVLRDNLGREVGSYKNGVENEEAKPGIDIYTTIDFSLQQYGELLLSNKVGAIVAISPADGEILAMVNSPGYDPNQLIADKNRGKHYEELASNPLKPFFDRTIQAVYPPGSLYKPVVALIGMELGTLPSDKTISCRGGYSLGGPILTKCHGHATCTNVTMAIQHSCNAYFVTVFRDIVDIAGQSRPQIGLDTFNYYARQFGIGNKLGVDFPREVTGNLPTSGFYTKEQFKNEKNGWKSVWIRSLGIGQGEVEMTTLQMANMAAAIANRGYFIQPHLIREISYNGNKTPVSDTLFQKRLININSKHYLPVIEGMELAVKAGTARASYVEGISLCGKTGTAENAGKDHSVFMGFADKENPKIAIAVYVENGGWGGSFAAPIASLMVEKYIHKDQPLSPARKYLEKRMIEADLLPLKP